jgi:hypothetical protein
MPKTLVDGRIGVREQYTTGEIAFLFGVSAVTAKKWLDGGVIPCFRLPTPSGHRRERRVNHRALMKYVADNPEFAFIFDKLSGDLNRYDPLPETHANDRPTRGRLVYRKLPKDRRGRAAAPLDPSDAALDDPFWSRFDD